MLLSISKTQVLDLKSDAAAQYGPSPKHGKLNEEFTSFNKRLQ